jgi:hypothetical protein
MWQCPKCKREFSKTNQSHSCVEFKLEKHFKGKEFAKELFDHLIEKINTKIKIESLPCCIHLVSNYTFGAVWALRDGIRIDFRLDHKIETQKLHRLVKMSSNRFLYYFDIKDKKEIDKEIIGYYKEAYSLNMKN